MGLVRFLLASAVILGHAPGWGGESLGSINTIRPMDPYYAVQAFFVVSGFYISMVLAEKYRRLDNYRRVFYVSRYLRLVPTYWLVCGTTLLCAFLLPNAPAYFVAALHGKCVPVGLFEQAKLGLVLIMNIALVGQDTVEFFSICGQTASGFLLVSQAWSLGTELLFYALAPGLVVLRNRWLISIAILSFASRIPLLLTLPFEPWQQRFFPADLWLFSIGILAYRAFQNLPLRAKPPGRAGQFVFVLLVSFILLVNYVPWATELTIPNSLVQALLFGCAVPFIFPLTAKSAFDRLLGDLSYPMYLWHICLGTFVGFTQGLWFGAGLLLVSMAISVPTVLLFERPIDAWRQRLIVGRRAPRLAKAVEPAQLGQRPA